jgi:glucose-6-phosphate-specific signal transduction histidine kinase
LELEQEQSGKLELELERVKRKAEELDSALAKEKQLGQQKIDVEEGIIQELKRELLTVEGQRDSFNAQVTGTALSWFQR